MTNYLLRHAQAFFSSLGGLARAPIASLMTIAVIGVTLSLPTGLYVVLDNIQRLSRGWEGSGQISLFLKRDTGAAAAQKLADKIRLLPAVAGVEYISRDAALAEFRRLSGFGAALDALEHNPLPAVLVVRPDAAHAGPGALESLAEELGRRREVELVQLDLQWVKRLRAMLGIGQRAALVLAGLLGLAVLLIVGNTARLGVLNRRDEIAVIKLVGGTDAFIRRPFLYSGLMQGLLGALTAWFFVGLSRLLLSGPIEELARLYESEFSLSGPAPMAILGLLGLGGALGWLGSRLALRRHLREIEPD